MMKEGPGPTKELDIGGPIGSKIKFDEVNSSASIFVISLYNVHHLDEVTVHSTSIWDVCT